MDTNYLWSSSNHGIDENPFSSTCQFSNNENNGGFSFLMDSPKEDIFSHVDFNYVDYVVANYSNTIHEFDQPVCESLSTVEATKPALPSLQDIELCDDDINGFSGWSEMDAGFGSEMAYLCCNDEIKKEVVEFEEEGEERISTRSSDTNNLSRMVISQYYYMPISQAAKELNVGLTHLKKRCRELGIRRWPHRKLMSLQTLINNVQEIGKEKWPLSEEELRNEIELLEQEKKLVEAMPDIELGHRTKRLRQACFKANYKKRRHMEQQNLMDSFNF